MYIINDNNTILLLSIFLTYPYFINDHCKLQTAYFIMYMYVLHNNSIFKFHLYYYCVTVALSPCINVFHYTLIVYIKLRQARLFHKLKSIYMMQPMKCGLSNRMSRSHFCVKSCAGVFDITVAVATNIQLYWDKLTNLPSSCELAMLNRTIMLKSLPLVGLVGCNKWWFTIYLLILMQQKLPYIDLIVENLLQDFFYFGKQNLPQTDKCPPACILQQQPLLECQYTQLLG